MIPIEAYTIAGVVRGWSPAAGELRGVLETEPGVEIRGATFAPVDRVEVPRAHDDLRLESDDILVALDTDTSVHPHAQWHDIRVVLGPWIVEGTLPTLPGFDPGRALTRPSGSFLQLRDARVCRLHDEALVADHQVVLVHRYAVEQAEADLDLGFYFPGASVAYAAPAQLT